MMYINETEILKAVEAGNLDQVKLLINEALENIEFSTTDKKRYNAFKSLAKKFSKDTKIVKEALKGAFNDEDGLLTLCNGFMIITIEKDSLEGCTMINEDLETMKVKQFFNADNTQPLDIDINNVLAELKKAKARKEKDYVYNCNDLIHFNPNYFKIINDCLDLTREETIIQWTTNINPIIFRNDNGKAILLPVRMNK